MKNRRLENATLRSAWTTQKKGSERVVHSARTAIKHEDFKKALALLSPHLDKDFENPALLSSALFSEAIKCARSLENNALAKKYFLKGIAIFPSDSTLLKHGISIFMHEENFKEAEEYLALNRKIDPKSAETLQLQDSYDQHFHRLKLAPILDLINSAAAFDIDDISLFYDQVEDTIAELKEEYPHHKNICLLSFALKKAREAQELKETVSHYPLVERFDLFSFDS